MPMTTPIVRRLARTVTTAPPSPGFGGEGHEAVFVLEPEAFAAQDPFILLADDRLNLRPGVPVGGAHPHAGFEIATFVVQGSIDEGDEGTLREGDVLWTTAGRGIVHGERAIPAPGTRILQLWFALPPADRWVDPHVHLVERAAAPVRREPGATARVYGGSSGEARVLRREHVPITMVDFTLDARATIEQPLPASYNGFLYVLDGVVQVGDGDRLRAGEVGWLDRHGGDDESVVHLDAGDDGARVVLYAGPPQHAPIVTHGPFVGGSRADLMRMSREYVAGRYVRMSDLLTSATLGDG